jgi:hypothetical protein
MLDFGSLAQSFLFLSTRFRNVTPLETLSLPSKLLAHTLGLPSGSSQMAYTLVHIKCHVEGINKSTVINVAMTNLKLGHASSDLQWNHARSVAELLHVNLPNPSFPLLTRNHNGRRLVASGRIRRPWQQWHGNRGVWDIQGASRRGEGFGKEICYCDRGCVQMSLFPLKKTAK